MAGYYLRRGERVTGPVDKDRLKELIELGQVVATDEFAKELTGPWIEVGRTKLFASLPAPPTAGVPAVIPPSQAPAVIQPPAEPSEVQGPVYAILRGGKLVFATVGRGMLTVSSGAMRGLGKWAERRHEIKLAKIKAQSDREIAEAQRPQPPVAPQAQSPMPGYSGQPIIHQTTVVNVTNRNETRTGCGGCAVLLLLLFFLWLLIMAGQHASR